MSTHNIYFCEELRNVLSGYPLLSGSVSSYVVSIDSASSIGSPGPEGYKTVFMLNSAEHEIYPANKSQITDKLQILSC